MASGKQKIPTTTTLSVRLPIEHKEAVEKAAVDARTTTSAYAARVLLEAATGKAPSPSKPSKADMVETVVAPTVAKGIVVSDPKALEELRRIGININQIAHALNAGRPTDRARLVDAIAKLFALLKDPEAFMQRIAQMPPIALPVTTKPAAAQASAPAAPKQLATVANQPWRAEAKPEAAPKPVVTPAPEPRQIAPHVFAEIAKSVAAKAEPITAPTRVSPSTAQPAAAMPPRPVAPSALPADPHPYAPAAYSPWTAPKPSAPAQVTAATAPTRSRPIPPRRTGAKARELYAAAHPHPASPPPSASSQQHLPAQTKPAASQTVTKDPRRDPPHPQARHQLQDRASVRPPRPGAAEERKPGRLGFLSKLWGR